MITLEKRNKFIDSIFKIEDKSFLEALKTIVDSKIASTTYELSDDKKASILADRASTFYVAMPIDQDAF